MRELIYYSKNAVTAGNLIKDNLMKAGRMDIVCNVLISAFYVSSAIREDVKLHLIFDGPPNSPMHLFFDSSKCGSVISKKDVAGLIKRMLYKAPKESGNVNEVFPGCFVEKKSFECLVKELDKFGKNVFVLDKKGGDIRNVVLKGNEVFIVGDHDGFPSDKKKFLKRIDSVSVSPKMLFASQVVVILHNEIDRHLVSV